MVLFPPEHQTCSETPLGGSSPAPCPHTAVLERWCPPAWCPPAWCPPRPLTSSGPGEVKPKLCGAKPGADIPPLIETRPPAMLPALVGKAYGAGQSGISFQNRFRFLGFPTGLRSECCGLVQRPGAEAMPEGTPAPGCSLTPVPALSAPQDGDICPGGVLEGQGCGWGGKCCRGSGAGSAG